MHTHKPDPNSTCPGCRSDFWDDAQDALYGLRDLLDQMPEEHKKQYVLELVEDYLPPNVYQLAKSTE